MCHDWKSICFYISKRTNIEDKKMGYAIFSHRKVTLTSRLNFRQLDEMKIDDIQYKLASNQLELQRQLSSSGQAKSTELSEQYTLLAGIGSDDTAGREAIETEIARITEYYDSVEQDINTQVYDLQAKENIYEMEKKRLETVITKIEKELENIEKSEASAIERANPKYDGVS